jgi:transketolase
MGFEIGKANLLRDGSDVAIIACGIMVPQALLAAEALAEKGISARVIDMHTIKPLDQEAVLAAVRDCGAVVTAEEHTVIGGLGSAVAEVLADRQNVPFERVGIMDRFGQSGKPPVLFEAYGLTDKHIIAACERVIARK